MRFIFRRYHFCVCALLLVACENSNTPQQDLEDTSYLLPPQIPRKWLTSDELLSPNYKQPTPIHNAYFVAVGERMDANHHFEGEIQLTSFKMSGANNVRADVGDYSMFPNVPLRFASDKGNLIPMDRDILVGTNNSYWRLLLSPGQVWSEAGDGNWSRASFPFILVHKQRNQAHNGIATFVYNDDEVSYLRIQVTQETTPWVNFDLWGQLSVDVKRQTYSDSEAVIDQFHAEQSDAYEVHSWQELEQIYTANAVAGINGNLGKTDISSTGVIIDDSIYMKPCNTRYGNYPYCQKMRHGAYSTTKSMSAAVALFRLAQKYGDDVGRLLIKDYLNVSAAHDGWESVTFFDALNMATGVGNNNAFENIDSGQIFSDEGVDPMEEFQQKDGKREMLKVAFSYNNYPWGPGEQLRYNSTHTFILSAAMDAFLKQQEGPNANIWDMLVSEVYHPIGIHHVPVIKTIESDPTENEIPVMYLGMYPTIDDVAKISLLLQNGGQHEGAQLLSKTLVERALSYTQEKGLRDWQRDNTYGNSHYLLSFWSMAWADNENCVADIPYMSGHGGNLIALLPNKVTAFRFADANNYDPLPLIQASANMKGLCRQ